MEGVTLVSNWQANSNEASPSDDMTEPTVNAIHRTTSLRQKLLLYAAALVLIPGLLFVVIVQQSGHSSLQRLVGGQLAREAAHTRDRFVATLRREREALDNFSQQDLMRDLRVRDIDKRVSAALATLRDGEDVRVGYLALDLQGEVVASSEPRWIDDPPRWIERPANGGERRGTKFDPIAMTSDGERAYLLETRIADPDAPTQTIGRLLGLYDWRRLTGVLGEVEADLEEHDIRAVAVIVDRTHAVLGGGGDGVAAFLQDVRWDDVVVYDAGHTSYSVFEDSGTIVGRAELGAEFWDWQLLVLDPHADAFAPVREIMLRISLLLAAVLVAALLSAAIAGRRVVRPLGELTDAVRDLSRQGFAKAHVPVESDDEVGTLAEAFNAMASELEQTQRALVDAAKFAMVGELAAGVAHELRTSLGVLRSSVQIVERTVRDDDPHLVELTHMIRAEVDRLGGIVNELLELGRARSPRLERVPVARPLERAIELARARAEEARIEIVSEPFDQELEVECDVEMILQVALNLMVNAIQAIGTGGRIEVRLRAAPPHHVAFEVVDDGPGIPPEIEDRIFRPFTTGREGGIGLGLTFVQRVVYEHHGSVEFETSSQGTRFRVELPRSTPRATIGSSDAMEGGGA